MSPEDAEEYTQALGQVLGGSWRQIELGQRLEVPKSLGLTTREWVEQRLGGYVRMQVEDRRNAEKELKTEGLSQRQIANVFGVDQKTVSNDLRSEENSSKPHPKTMPEQASHPSPEGNSSPPNPHSKPSGKPKPKGPDDPEQVERDTRRSYQEGLVRFAHMDGYAKTFTRPAQRQRAIGYWPPTETESIRGIEKVTPKTFRLIAEAASALADLLEGKDTSCITSPKNSSAKTS
jgi:hypothetical protein